MICYTHDASCMDLFLIYTILGSIQVDLISRIADSDNDAAHTHTRAKDHTHSKRLCLKPTLKNQKDSQKSINICIAFVVLFNVHTELIRSPSVASSMSRPLFSVSHSPSSPLLSPHSAPSTYLSIPLYPLFLSPSKL
jgi:hypothetical protein